MKKTLWIIFPMIFFLFLAACSGEKSKESGSDSKMADRESKKSADSSALTNEKSSDDAATNKVVEAPTRMVIYQAELQLRVKNFESTISKLEQRAAALGGYIVQSNVSREGNEEINGTLTIRIPQKHFQTFMKDAEGRAAEVIDRHVTGQDVSEEYIDLESRLKSKRAVEARLMEFMKNAAKTEDLLKISSDLSVVQEDIEKIEGRIKFLQNQTQFSTITVSLYENKVVVPNLDKKLNTWERTKKQFFSSTNTLLAVLSGLVVFLIGNLPVFLILAITGAIVFLFYKKVVKKERGSS